MRRWSRARKDILIHLESKNSGFENEIWLDELPWDETSFYIKAILRNWLLYRLIEKNNVVLGDPIWAFKPKLK